ncbi:hypothetical protein [Intrasporangium sp. YIM S08009]|uniref:hypothetical protein n=1 Tax=Intrasporangium zincisolvens TaxID=3080018 RepID=UPI002B055071|nr:hypothetical protein [Intrasporangium sp. YIM S08009]
MSVRLRVAVVAAIALALLVAAAVVWAQSGPAVYGWFAYAPLSDDAMVPDVSMLTPRMQVALGLAAGGLVLLAGLAGFWIGRRVSRGAPR